MINLDNIENISERNNFKALQLSNPNFFGNLESSLIPPKLSICCNKIYEEIACLGYQPEEKMLEAVVNIYQPSGYGSGICGEGTPEYIRFYLSYNDGADWEDVGLASFQVYNVPEGTDGTKKLEYAASLPINPLRKFCTQDPLIQVRAILSWNNIPPENAPNWKPVWGNVAESTIQVDPFNFIITTELFELLDIKPKQNILDSLDLNAPIKAAKKELVVGELAKMYCNENVPASRFAFKQLNQFASNKVSLNPELVAELLPGIDISEDIIDILGTSGDGNTSYEELHCVGLDPNLPDTLVGVIEVKKGSGYSGNLCSSGSKEYVTFWADFDNTGTWDCLGTTDVSVYDLQNTPKDGIHYAVRLPVDLEPYRKQCEDGPKVVNIRAILSWNVPAPCSNPNYLPTWGNREESRILISPISEIYTPGKIAILGGIPVSMIDNVTGLASGDAIFALNNLPINPYDNEGSPFDGRVSLQGSPLLGHTYKVEVSEDGIIWAPVVSTIKVTDSNGIVSDHAPNPVTQRYSYLNFTDNVNSLLAQWDTPVSSNENWYVRLSTYNAGGLLVGIDQHRIQLDSTVPTAFITITNGAGDCGKFQKGVTIEGKFTATDQYFRRYALSVTPASAANGAAASPSSGTIGVNNGDWELNTGLMDPCGFVMRLGVHDQVIINSQSIGHYVFDDVGFCLDE
ncbi:MAG: hypothetical protein ACRBCI_09220 [Cellvibrionaceae bacterium]